jgi:hypothetical protein
MRLQNDAFFGYIEMLNGIVPAGVELFVYIAGQVPAEVDIIAVAAQAIAVVRNNFDRSLFHFFEYAFVA